MPYISKEVKENIKKIDLSVPGNVNYMLSRLVVEFIIENKESYNATYHELEKVFKALELDILKASEKGILVVEDMGRFLKDKSFRLYERMLEIFSISPIDKLSTLALIDEVRGEMRRRAKDSYEDGAIERNGDIGYELLDSNIRKSLKEKDINL